MKRRRTAEEVARLLREADRDLAKGLTISDICRKVAELLLDKQMLQDIAKKKW